MGSVASFAASLMFSAVGLCIGFIADHYSVMGAVAFGVGVCTFCLCRFTYGCFGKISEISGEHVFINRQRISDHFSFVVTCTGVSHGGAGY